MVGVWRWGRGDALQEAEAREPLLPTAAGGGGGGLGRIEEAEIQIRQSNQLSLDLSRLPLREQLVTPEWLGLLLFFNVHLLTSTYVLTAVGDQVPAGANPWGGGRVETCIVACR